jgi:cytochrome c biogenesis protein CcmG/thiol:disulfide interchange protein DsbE
MPFVRRWLSRGLDGLAIVVVLYALFHFFVQPRLIREAAEPAPPVALAALDGGRFSLAEHRGRVVFLDFWASWCAPCKQSLPLVEHYARAHPDIDVVAVNVGESAAAARAYARQTRLANVVLDPDEIAAHAYGINGFPTMVVVDPAGLVRAKWIGYDPAVEQAMADARRRYGKAARATAPWGAVLPRHIAARYASLDHSSLDGDPVGLGPFVVTRWQRGERLEFARNPTLQLRATTTNIVDYLQFNLHSPLLRDPVLRRAIALAVDRRSLAAKVYRSSSSLPTACNPIRAIARRKRCRPSTRPPRGAY